MSGWWIVMLPGEDASASECYGPFRSEAKAQAAADQWNTTAPPHGQATVMPILPPRTMR